MRRLTIMTAVTVFLLGCTFVTYGPDYYVPRGSHRVPRVDHTVEQPVVNVTVPPLSGLGIHEAQEALFSNTLIPGDISYQASSERKDRVIGQRPAAGTPLPAYSSVGFTVSAGTSQVVVPALVGLDPEGADAALRAYGLRTGTVQYTEFRGIRDPQVVRQSPAMGRTVPVNTLVSYTVAIRRRLISVPNVTGRSLRDAKKTLQSARLKLGKVTLAYGGGQPGTVAVQRPSRGASVEPGTAVNLTVTAAPALVSVPDLSRISTQQAKRVLSEAGLALGKTGHMAGTSHAYIVSQMPKAGSRVQRGSKVNVVLGGPIAGRPRPAPKPTPAPKPLPAPEPTLTLAPKPRLPARMLVVPFVTGRPKAEACALLERAGLKYSVTTVEQRRGPENVVISQSPAAGTRARTGDVVKLVATASRRPSPRDTRGVITVPSLVGKTEGSALSILRRAGLAAGKVEKQQVMKGQGKWNGRIIRQNPAAGQKVARGSAVDLVTAIEVREPSEERPPVAGRVPAPEPRTGTARRAPTSKAPEAPKAEKVRLPVEPKPAPKPEKEKITVPNVVGKDLKEARKILSNAKLSAGRVHFVAGEEDGKVVAQAIKPGTKIPARTKVNLTVSIKE